MVYVDRLISSACFESANEGLLHGHGSAQMPHGRDGCLLSNNGCNGGGSGGCNSSEGQRHVGEGCSKKGTLIECRICQEEDEEKELEAPCACNGTLKFAHRKCIQRWCNKKGDITCEICNQVYAPNYSVPHTRATSDGLAIDIRQNWGPRIDLHDPHILAIAAAEHRLLQAEYEDYAVANTTGIGVCRSVALALMLLLLVRHALSLTRDSGFLQESFTVFNVSLLQFAGLLLPCYVILRVLYVLQSRRRRQVGPYHSYLL
ncbi:unnamed protein product [Victoria cruziana]